MRNGQTFLDAYSILQVHPECDAKTLEAAYRSLAKQYHPDHPLTSDFDKFNEVIVAYRLLRDPQHRVIYDLQYAIKTGFAFSSAGNELGDEIEAISDADAHAKVLMLLYKRRREHPQKPGMGHYEIQEMLRCSDQAFDFHIWYLKEKGFIGITEEGTLAISIAGVEHVISSSKTAAREKVLIGYSQNQSDHIL